MRILVLLAVIGLMTAARSFEVEGDTIGSATALAVGFLLLTAYMTGWIAKQLRMPKLTGYLAAGLVAGESVMGLIPEAATGDLKIFTGVAVSLIALTAGTELELKTMRPLLRTIGWMTVIARFGTVFVLTLTVWLLRPWLPFMSGLSPGGMIAIAAVLGVVISANSPAVVVALRTEMAAEGPLCRTVLGTVVVGDLVVIILFAAVGSAAAPFLGNESEQGELVHLVWHIGGSLVVGAVLAGLLYVFLRFVAQSRALFVVAIAFVVAEVGARIGLDPLIVALSAGTLVRNATRFGDELHEAIEGSSLPVYLVFFAAAGATIHLDVLAVVGVPAVLLVVIRALSYLGTARIATQIAGSEPVVKKFVGVGLLPQAGLALALGLLMAKTFPSVGQAAGTLVLGVVALNEILMPIVYRYALIRAGEAGRAATQGHSAAYPIVPIESSSQNMIAQSPEDDSASMSFDPSVESMRGASGDQRS